jgi:hypothetical protein
MLPPRSRLAIKASEGTGGLCVRWVVGWRVLFIWFVYTFCLYGWLCLAKVFKGFRFDAELYSGFKRVAGAGGFTVTGAFERFMRGCVECGFLVFPDERLGDFEVEARVLADWLGKGKRFYRLEDGVEVNVQGRLFGLLSKVRDAGLKAQMEKVLKNSVSEQ